MGVALGLDVGTKTIGIAASDALGMLAFPVLTLSRKGVRVDSAKVAELAKQREATAIIVGLPLELEGHEERSARLARQIGTATGELTGLPVHYMDERFTSVDAERQMIAAGVSRKKRKAVIDQAAAVLILQGWLDGGTPVTDGEGEGT